MVASAQAIIGPICGFEETTARIAERKASWKWAARSIEHFAERPKVLMAS